MPKEDHSNIVLSISSVEEDTVQDKKSPVTARKVPSDVTLVTNDVALLCDNNIEGAHKSAITFFWNRI